MAKAKLRKRHLNNDIDKLDDIACDLWAAVQHIRRIKPVPLSKRQHKALDHVLRALDGLNEYALGDELRKAFKVELDGLHDA